MGYELHITRAEEWWESEHQPIAWEEWEAAVADDPDLTFSETDWVDLSNQSDKQPLVDWIASEKHAACLYWLDGRIVSKDPSDALIAKMVELSKRFGGGVYGDDGESYPLDEESVTRSGNGCLATVACLVLLMALLAAQL